MLVEVVTPEGLVLLQSPLLRDAGFAHGFSTRIGGVSSAPFDTLNLQSSRANADLDASERDAESNLLENRRRFAKATGIDPSRPIAEVSQVHGCGVATSVDALAARQFADAMTSAPGEGAALIRIADCVPILVGCNATGMVAAMHAGWRGVVAGVVGSGIAALLSRGAQRASLRAAIGPCIRTEQFEIGDEVTTAFSKAGLREFITEFKQPSGKQHADLVKAVSMQLRGAGIAARNFDSGPPCTFEDPKRFFSFRRDGVRSGRLAAIIAPRGVP